MLKRIKAYCIDKLKPIHISDDVKIAPRFLTNIAKWQVFRMVPNANCSSIKELPKIPLYNIVEI